MAPDVHLVQGLPDLDLGSGKVTYPHYIGGALQHLFDKVSSKMHGWGSRTPTDPYVRVGGVQPQQETIRT